MDYLYSILDVKASRYGALMTFENDNTALRAFQEMLISGDKNSMLYLYPTDYCLFCVGTYDKITGQIVPSSPQLVVTGFDCIAKAVDEVNRRKKLREAFESGRSTDVEVWQNLHEDDTLTPTSSGDDIKIEKKAN